MGLLDSKKRILDTIVTVEGRRQMARGRMNICFATFTDQDAFYEGDIISGTTDAQQRPHLEAFSRPQDTITFESDDVGALLQFKGSKNDVIAGHVLIASGSKYLNFPAQTERRDAQLGLLTSSIDNFKNLYAIGTIDTFDDDMMFSLSQQNISFDIVDGMLSNAQGLDVASIDDVESLFQDKRLSHIQNFKYLPPKNAPTPEEPNGSLLGDYIRLDQGNSFSYEKLRSELSTVQHKTINFTETSRESNIFGQFFEINDNLMRKLDVIDYGEFIDKQTLDSKHVYFVGKIFSDSRNSHTFVNIFTLIFS